MNSRTIKQSFLSVALISLIYPFAHSFAADEQQFTDKTTKSFSYQGESVLTLEERTEKLKATEADTFKAEFQKTFNNSAKQATRQRPSGDHEVYDVITDLVSDYDFDGFYQRFAITVDVDTIYQHSDIYADLYLSLEGGPFIYYASTSIYHINHDSALDRFTIETELADGYPTGYYELQIRVYDAQTDEYLLTYDGLNDSSLIDIPLEDRYWDSNYSYSDSYIESEVIVSHGAGSFNLMYLFVLALLFGFVRVYRLANP